MHFFDGFRTSHEMSSIELISQEEIKSIFPFEKALEHKNRGVNPAHPYAIGVAYGDDVWMQTLQTHQPYYDAVPEKVQEAMDLVAKVSGRQYHLFDYVGSPEAENVMVVMGASAQTAEETVEYLNKQGEKVGVMKVHLWRPFSLKHFAAALPKTVKKVCVLDKVREENAYADPLYLDVNCAIRDLDRDIKVICGEFGVAGKEFTPNLV